MGGGFDTPQAASFGNWGRRGYSVGGLSVNRYIHDVSRLTFCRRRASPPGLL
jgi:hypothetical protein